MMSQITPLKHSLKRAGIVLLLALFCFGGIIACNKKSTMPLSSFSEAPDPAQTGPVTDSSGDDSSSDNTGSGDNNGGNTVITVDPGRVYNLYTPFTGSMYTKINYTNTEALKEAWTKMIQRKGNNDGKQFVLTQPDLGDNRHIYFDKDMNMVESATKKIIQYFKGTVIVKYNGGAYANTWTIGGLYALAEARTTDTKNNELVNLVTGSKEANRVKGALSIIVLNTGYSSASWTQFGPQVSLNYTGITNESKYLGKNPDNPDGEEENRYPDSTFLDHIFYDKGNKNVWFAVK